MTARVAYDKWTRSLKETEHFGYPQGAYTRIYPASVPVAYDFLSSSEKDTWREFARSLTPRKNRVEVSS